jgi:signal transduction histidine kinase
MIDTYLLDVVTSFQGVPQGELEWLARHLTLRNFVKGDTLFSQDDEAHGMYLLLNGDLEYIRYEGGKEVATFLSEPGEIGGQLPFSRMKKNGATIYALSNGCMALLDSSIFKDLQQNTPAILQRLVNEMVDRTRDYTRISEQRERLTSLGRLAAGLAHELNNPASAAKRAADTLEKTLQLFDEHASSLLKQILFNQLPLSGDPFQPIYDAMNPDLSLDTLTRSDLEDELLGWLEGFKLPDAWNVAATLVSAGYKREVLESFSKTLLPERVPDFLIWLSNDSQMRLLSRELAQSTARISELIQAMKTYSYMDQGQGKQTVNLHEGIDSTLLILKNRLEQKSLEVVKHYEDVPDFQAYGSELNQVWTNLLNNAIDASHDGGMITVHSSVDIPARAACIEITDTGTGIPQDIQSRIFEPFFTTKAVGEGTGMGLDIVNRIVRERHRGTVSVSSKSGLTKFSVRLPMDQISKR